MPVNTPYFVADPLLDGPFPPPGWFGGAEIQVVKPHLINRLKNDVQNSAQRSQGTSTTVALPSAPLDWTVAPRFFVGYRLPSGFGEFAVAYRYLATVGSAGVRGVDGPASLHSRLAFNMIDLDYSSRQLNLGHSWDMKWTFGFRILSLFFDSRSDQPLAQAAAGSGIYQEREFNNLVGLGPHTALDMARHLGDSGWALRLRTDFSSQFDWINTGFFTRSTSRGPAGQPLAGQSYLFGHQNSPIINIQAGLSWQPSRFSSTRFFLGYQYENFWALSSRDLQRPIDGPALGPGNRHAGDLQLLTRLRLRPTSLATIDDDLAGNRVRFIPLRATTRTYAFCITMASIRRVTVSRSRMAASAAPASSVHSSRTTLSETASTASRSIRPAAPAS